MKQLQAKNARLKRIYADIAMQNELVKEALAKKVARQSIA
jgi:putative transposase